MSWNKAEFDVKTGKIVYSAMTSEEIAEAQAAQAEAEAKELEKTQANAQ